MFVFFFITAFNPNDPNVSFQVIQAQGTGADEPGATFPNFEKDIIADDDSTPVFQVTF